MFGITGFIDENRKANVIIVERLVYILWNNSHILSECLEIEQLGFKVAIDFGSQKTHFVMSC